MKTPICVILCATGLLLTGCLARRGVQMQALAQKRTFAPIAAPASRVAAAPVFPAIKLRPFRALPPFDVRTFIVRRAGGEFAADFYNGWIVAPQDLIRVQTQRYLEEAGLFAAVYDVSSGTLARLSAEGIVSELFLDYTGEKPAAVVTLRLLVLDEHASDFTVLFTAEKSARVTFETADKIAPSKAFGAALTQTLELLTQALTAAPLPKTPR